MPGSFILTTTRSLRRMRIRCLGAMLFLALMAAVLWLMNQGKLALVTGAVAWAALVAIAVTNFNAKRHVPSHLSIGERNLFVRYLTGSTQEIPWASIEAVRKVETGPLILTLRGGKKITLRTSRQDAQVVAAQFQTHGIRVV